MADEVREKTSKMPIPDNVAVFDRIVDILEEARSHVARTVNRAIVVAYWLIGREIIEQEQAGQKRADYGKAVIEDLSRRLTERYGKGYSTVSLWNMRKFYQTYIGRSATILSPSGRESSKRNILSPMGRELGRSGKLHITGAESVTGFHPDLSWSHYRALMRVEKRISARQCEKLLVSDVPFGPGELLSLCNLCSDQDLSYCLAAVRRVLTHRGIDPEKALAMANSMRSDEDGNVQDAVHQFLDQRARAR